MNLKIADYFGIPLYLNMLAIPFVAYIHLSSGDIGNLALAILFISLFFVVLHEYGHCFMARRLGWKVFDITILPIGGVARINFKHSNPQHEILVALAGPAVSLFFAILFFVLMMVAVYIEDFRMSFVCAVPFISNAIILLFNLLPIFPMDGGRVFRALLSLAIGHSRATWWAVRIGQFGGVGLGSIALYYGYWLAGCVLIMMAAFSQNELAHAKLLTLLFKIRKDVAVGLNKPELEQADLPELISAVESVEDLDLKEKIQVEELLPLLKDLKQNNLSI
jgi:Zn-dependent protease